MESGTVDLGQISSMDTKSFSVKFNKVHSKNPNAVIVSYDTYSWFYGSCHVEYASISNSGFNGDYIPIVIGNGNAGCTVHWLAIWE